MPLLAGSNWGNDVAVQGFEAGPDTDGNSRFNEVGAGYFRTLGVPLMAGREFTDGRRTEGAPKVAIVNEAFVKKFKLGSRRGRQDDGNRAGAAASWTSQIVGVVQNAKYSEVKDEIPPLFFQPYRQDERSWIRCVLRAHAPAIRRNSRRRSPRVVKALDPNLPMEDLKTMPQQVRETRSSTE